MDNASNNSELRYLTAQEIAVELRVDPLTVRRWASEGNFPAPLRIGRVVRFPRDAVVAFIQSRMPGGSITSTMPGGISQPYCGPSTSGEQA